MNNKADVTKKHKICKFSIAIIISVIIFLLIIIAVVYVSNSDKKNKELIGTWRYDQYTEYVFKDSSKGCICLDNDTHYEFTYAVNGNIMCIDFELNYVTDCRYTYTVDKNEMTLVGGEGTAQIGKVYKLTKVEV